jgi:hypothetical protein
LFHRRRSQISLALASFCFLISSSDIIVPTFVSTRLYKVHCYPSPNPQYEGFEANNLDTAKFLRCLYL